MWNKPLKFGIVSVLTLIGIFVNSGCNLLGQSSTSTLALSGSTSSPQPSGTPSSQSSAIVGPKILSVATLNVAGSEGNIVADSDGNIFYLDVNAGNIVKVTPNGSQAVFVSYGALGGYGTIAIDKNNVLYVAANWTIVKVSPSGEISPLGGGVALQIAVDSNGNVYYTEASEQYVSTNVIKKVTPSGVVSTFAGSSIAGKTNANGTLASFNNLQSLVTDSAGNVYVVDAGNYLVRKITPTGDVTTLAGSGVQAIADGIGTAASFYFRPVPAVYLTIDASGNLYVGDNMIGTGYIRKITPNGSVTTYCGNGSSTDIDVPGSCDLTGLWINMGLTVAPSGSIYFVSGTSLFTVLN